MTISLVSGSYSRGTASSGSTISVTLAQTPTQGNTLVAVIGTNQTGGSESVSSITQTGVTWSVVVPEDPVVANEIWMGVVGSGASTSVSIALAQSVFAAVADICEWSGLASNPVDQTATNNGTSSTQTDTGTTATTTQANELFIGTVGVYGQAQSSPTNSFTMLDGAYFNVTGGISVSYLYKIVSSTGAANSGTTIATSSNAWQGCIATFKGASAGTASKLAYTAGTSQSINAGSISSVVTVQVQDANGNPVTTGATVSLSTSSNGGSFYSDSGGNTQITSIVISSGQSSGNFYYKDTTVAGPTLTASATGLTSATTQFTISLLTADAPLTLSTSGELSLNYSSPLQVSNNSLSLSASPTFSGLTTTGNATIWDLLTVGSISVSGNETVNGILTVIGDASSDQLMTNSASIGAISTANITINNNTTLNGTSPDILTPGPRYLPTMPTNLSGLPSIQFHNIKNTPSGPGVPQGAFYADTSPQSLFLVEMQDMGGTDFIQFLTTNYGLWVQKDIETYGAIMTTSDPSRGSGGGAIEIGHGFTSTTADPTIILTDTVTGGSGATATLTVNNGTITAVNITNQGSNYNFADVTVGGIGAQLTPVIANGHIQSITVVNGGQNYLSSNTLSITDTGNGSGATATLTVNNGVITAVNVTNQGNNYTYTTAKIAVNTTNGSGARLAPVIGTSKAITSINVFDGGSGYSASDTVSITNNSHNTLYLTQETTTGTSPANLDLQDLTVHGNLTVDGQANISGSGSQYITSIASGAPFAVTNGALSLNSFAHSYINDWSSATSSFVTSNSSPTLNGLTINGNASISGYAQFNNDAKLTWVNTSTLAVQSSSGGRGYLDAGAVYVNYLQPLDNGDVIITCPLNLNGTRGSTGQVLTSQGNSAPSWTTPANVSNYAANMNQYVRTTDSPTFDDLYVNGHMHFNNDAQIVWVNTGVLEIQTSAGAWANLDLQNIYIAGNIMPLGGQGYISVGTELRLSGNCRFNNDAYIGWANTGVLSIYTSNGSMGNLDVNALFANNINNLSGSLAISTGSGYTLSYRQGQTY